VNEVDKPVCVEHILVSLDSSTHSFAALQAAVELSRHYDADLRGIFVEDITLLHLAESPFHKEVGEYSAIVREISTEEISRGILVQSKWVINTFRKLINQTNIRGDFSILRGKVIEMIYHETERCDLLVIGKTGTNLLRKRGLGSTTKYLIKHSKISLFLVEEDNRIGYPMIVLYEDSATGQISLETARELLDLSETLVILVDEDNPDKLQRNKAKIEQWATENKITISIQTYKKHAFEHFIEMIMGLKEGLFILPHTEDPLQKNIVENCLKRVTLPIFFIRKR
jgi:nucleotide-binding universal stress UspA family protein